MIGTAAAAWVLAIAVLASRGELADAGLAVGFAAWVAVVSAITVRITPPPEPEEPVAAARRSRLLVQLGLLLAWMVAVELEAPPVPWLEEWLDVRGQELHDAGWLLGPDHLHAPVMELLIPLLLVVAAGADLRSLGLRRGRWTARVSLLWCAPALLITVVQAARGVWGVEAIGLAVVFHTMQNGFFEEFLHRGCVQSRLTALTGVVPGLVLAAILFGLSHLHVYDGPLDVRLASCIAFQGVAGIQLGLIFERTRSLAACSIVHVAYNALALLMAGGA